MNCNLVAIHYNKGKSKLFRINVDVTLCDLKDQLNGLLNNRDTRRLVPFEYCHMSTDANGYV